MGSTLWSDEHTGPRWRYGLTLRSPVFGGAPAGWLIGSWRKGGVGYHDGMDYAFGTIDYPFEVPAFEVAQFSLVEVEVAPVLWATAQRLRLPA